MRQASKRAPDSAEKTVRDIRRATRRHQSAEEKIRVLEGLRGEDSIAELCRKEGILEAGKKRLAGDTAREATSRGGFTSKIHCLGDARGRPISFGLTPGEA